MRRRLITLLLLMGAGLSPILAQETKVDKTKVKGVPATNPDAGRQHIQVTGGNPPSTGDGARPPMAVQAQLDLFKSQIADLQALVEKQKAQLASLSSTVAILQQDSNKLYAKAMAFELVAKDEQAHYQEYLAHAHTLGNGFGFTQQGNFYLVTANGVQTLKQPTSGPVKGK